MKTIAIRILEERDIYFAQSEAAKVLDGINFDLLDHSKIKIIISELAYNIIKYAKKGTIKISRIEERGNIGVLIEAIDFGPGIKNLEKALSNHYSSSGTLGLGLPGVKRMSDNMIIDSEIDKGTHVSVIYWNIR